MAKVGKHDIGCILIAFLLILFMMPYWVWGVNVLFFRIPFLLLSYMYVGLKSVKQKQLLAGFIVLISSIQIMKGNNIFGLIDGLCIAFIMFLQTDSLSKTYLYFTRLLSILLAGSLIVLLLVTLGLPISSRILPPLNELKSGYYISFPLLLVYVEKGDSLLRFCAMFDEPGVVGTICSIILFIEGFNLKKFSNVVFFISGILTFSLFFYLGILVFLIVRVFIRKNIKTTLYTMLGIVVFFFVISSVAILRDSIGVRIQYDSTTHEIRGDNRASEELVHYIDVTRGSSHYFFGYPQKDVVYYSGSAGYRNAILTYGVVFLAFYFLFMHTYIKTYSKSNKVHYFYCISILILVLYQRPGILAPEYLFLFACLFRICAINFNGYSYEKNKSNI